MLGSACAGSADIGEPPEAPAALARQDEQDRAGAASMLPVPLSSTRVTLTGTQIRRQRIMASMLRQVRQRLGRRNP